MNDMRETLLVARCYSGSTIPVQGAQLALLGLRAGDFVQYPWGDPREPKYKVTRIDRDGAWAVKEN